MHSHLVDKTTSDVTEMTYDIFLLSVRRQRCRTWACCRTPEEQQGGLAEVAATRIRRLLAAKLDELRSMQSCGGIAPTHRPSANSSGAQTSRHLQRGPCEAQF